MSAVLDSLAAISADLAAVGVPPLSPYWKGEAERFYMHPTARVLVECVGRGGDKSRTSTVMAIAETLAGDFTIPPGERHYFTHVSENREEAAKTLGVLEQYLRILRIGYSRTGDTIELEGLARGIKVLAARIGAVSGWRCIGWTADEAAKWDNDGVDPAEEVIASIKAMTVTHSNARGRIFSSPLATLGHFYETWHAGASDGQLTGHAPSWVANPSITEEQTRRLERDKRKHAREYGAKPAEAHEESLLDPAAVDRSRRARPGDVRREPGVLYTAAMDPSLGRNAWSFVIAGARDIDGRRKASVVLHREWRAPRGTTLDMGAIMISIAHLCDAYGVRELRTDQYHGESLAAIADRLDLGIAVEVDKPTAAERMKRWEGLAMRFLDDAVELPYDPIVKADLLGVRRRVTKGADGFGVTMPVSGDGRHCDFAPAVCLALERVAVDEQVGGWLPAMRRVMAAEKSERDYQSPARLIALEAHRDRQHLREGQYRCDRAVFGTECEYAHADFLGTATWKAGDYKPTFSADAEPGLKHNAAAYFKRQYPGGQAA